MIRDGSARDTNSEKTDNVIRNQANDNDDGFGSFAFQSESLRSLVQPELLSLSQHWLSALRDHALLSLPPGKIFVILVIFYQQSVHLEH